MLPTRKLLPEKVLKQIEEREKYLPDHWVKWIKENIKLGYLSTYDFKQNYSVHFEDGSIFTIYNALIHTDRNETAIFTEHNGYHIFKANSIEEIKMI